MGSNCAPLVAYLFLFCYESDFMVSLSDNNQADVIEPSNSKLRYLDDILNINTPYIGQMLSQIYPTGLQLKKQIILISKPPLFDLDLSIMNGKISSKSCVLK